MDVLIEIHDDIDIYFSKCDVGRNPGEPIVILGPLGWSCVGHPQKGKPLSETTERIWPVPFQPDLIYLVRREDYIGQQWHIHDGERYRVATPWIGLDCRMFPNNYEMANYYVLVGPKPLTLVTSVKCIELIDTHIA